MLLEQHACLGERTVAGRPIEELVAEFILQAPDRLADRRLRAVQFLGGLGKTAILGDCDKRIEVLQLHGGIIRNVDAKSKTINLTKPPEPGSTVMGGLHVCRSAHHLRYDTARR